MSYGVEKGFNKEQVYGGGVIGRTVLGGECVLVCIIMVERYLFYRF
jgi:hypothetical protein